ncbi:MAG: 3'-5' exoribonuclease YhaM family protein [Proteobacteria bacterium]|nr:3'-5' exoribonuclease YhaM family protein [Pseudomonadota bacterium]MBU1709558.1 3'-5' exoribonuclease YhaM family protein [Pseudomonadota bacterium]
MPPEKGLFVKEIKDNQAVEGLFMVKEMSRAETKTGSLYLMLTVSDRTGEIAGRIWDKADYWESRCQPGSIVFLSGQGQVFRNSLQLKINSIEAFDTTDIDLSLFLPSTANDPEVMCRELIFLAESVTDIHLRKLLLAFLNSGDFIEQFKKAPAAKMMHHAYYGGLLEHTLAVARLADSLAGHYAILDRSLLIAGAIFHDIGKIKEYSYANYPFQYTDSGRLVGHMVLGIEMLNERIRTIADFPEALATQLSHLILSHHGQHQFGSPTVPMTMEAFMLHFIDDLDAKMNTMEKLGEQFTEPGRQWTDYQRHLERFLFLSGSEQKADDLLQTVEKPTETSKETAAEIEVRQRSLFGS